MNKKNLILGGVLLVLLALAYAYQGPLNDLKDKKNKESGFLANLDIDKISRIELNGPEIKKTFIKDNDKWAEEGMKSNLLSASAIDMALSVLKQAKDGEMSLVSEIKDKQGEFETSEEKGIKLSLKNGEEILNEFIIGKVSSDFKGSYISEINSDKTYLAGTNLNSAFSHGEWYDKTIFAAGDNKITKIRFQYPSREFTVEKNAPKEGEAEVWGGTLPYKFPVDQSKIEAVVNIMSELHATEIPEQKFDGTGLEKNLIIIEAKGESFSRVLMVGEANKDGLYFAKKGDSDNIYLISKEQRDQLEKRISDLK